MPKSDSLTTPTRCTRVAAPTAGRPCSPWRPCSTSSRTSASTTTTTRIDGGRIERNSAGLGEKAAHGGPKQALKETATAILVSESSKSHSAAAAVVLGRFQRPSLVDD